jgi:hypothetical protein
VTLSLAIGVSWGAYKERYTKEFAMTTTSAGASLFCGLFEVPSRFASTCSDETYFTWIAQHTSFKPWTQPANNFAIRQVFRFWLTYPGHLFLMLSHKMMRCLYGDDLWPGYFTQVQASLFRYVSRPGATLSLVAIMAVCVVTGYERRRTLLLAWALLFNVPLFWVTFSSLGRFYSAAPVAMLTAAVPPLFEKQFYASIVSRPWRTASVLACAAVVAIAAWPLHDWLLRRDAFHYWTPFLDPANSLLNGLK